MKIAEILEIEKDNTNKINLIHEGIFWRCYEISSYLFVKYVKEYKIIKKFIKSINDYIVYCGFPDNVIDDILSMVKNNDIINEENKKIILIDKEVIKDDYIIWKYNIQEIHETKYNEQKINEIKIDSISVDYNKIINAIINYDIANSTPIECQNFLLKLKMQIKNGSIY